MRRIEAAGSNEKRTSRPDSREAYVTLGAPTDLGVSTQQASSSTAAALLCAAITRDGGMILAICHTAAVLTAESISSTFWASFISQTPKPFALCSGVLGLGPPSFTLPHQPKLESASPFGSTSGCNGEILRGALITDVDCQTETTTSGQLQPSSLSLASEAKKRNGACSSCDI